MNQAKTICTSVQLEIHVDHEKWHSTLRRFDEFFREMQLIDRLKNNGHNQVKKYLGGPDSDSIAISKEKN